MLPEHILKFLENEVNEKYRVELLNLLIKRINELCFNECQIDRIQCTLTPMCGRRYLINLRIKNGLKVDKLPSFCYSVQKNIVFRDFRNKTNVYRPFDAYLYLIDFLDIYFHGDYRKLNKFISFKNWDDAFKILDDRIHNRNEDFEYQLYDNYIVIKYGDRIHVLFLEKNYALCNANRESIATLELLLALLELHFKNYFPIVQLNLIPHENHIQIKTVLPSDIVLNIKETSTMTKSDDLEKSRYFLEVFPEDIEALTVYCKKISLIVDENDNLEINLNISLETNNYIEGSGVGFKTEHGKKQVKMPLRYRDMRIIYMFINRLYRFLFNLIDMT